MSRRFSAALTLFALLGLTLAPLGCASEAEDGYVAPAADPDAENPPPSVEPEDPNDV